MLNIFISGLEKETGKTTVISGLASTMQSLSYSTGVYKPIQIGVPNLGGFKQCSDLMSIKAVDENISTNSIYLINGKNSPFVSSYEDNIKINVNAIYDNFLKFVDISDCTIVEGSKSISTPIAEGITELELVKALGLPLILVINPSKTPIDLCISGLNYIKQSNVKFLGIILNQYNENSNNLEEKFFPQILNQFIDVNILGILPDFGDIKTLKPEILIENTLNRVDIEKIFGLEISKLHY